MKTIKKTICFVLILTLALTILPVTAFAASGIVSGNYKYVVLDNGNAQIMDYLGSDADVSVPAEIDGYTVTSIGKEAFCEKNSLVSLVIPDTVTHLGEWALSYNNNLKSVTLPDSITDFEQGMFDYDRKLTTVNLPSGLTQIPRKTFLDCESLRQIGVPATVISIGDEAFCGCYKLESITFPNGLVSIGEDAFADCKALASVTLPSTLTTIGEDGFFNCTGFSTVLIPASVESIGEEAFGYTLNEYNGIIKRSTFTIKGWTDTAAEQYASDNGFTFTAMAAYGTPATVTFDSSGGTGEMAPLNVAVGDTITVPECGFTREECSFVEWQYSYIAVYQPGDLLTVVDDITLRVQWKLNGVHDETYLDRSEDASTSQLTGSLKLTDTRTGKVYTEEIDGGTFASAYTAPYSSDPTDMVGGMTEELYTAAEKYADRDKLNVTKDKEVEIKVIDTWDKRRFEFFRTTRSSGEPGNLMMSSGDYGHKWNINVILEAEFESPEFVALCTGTTGGGTYQISDSFYDEPLDYSVNMTMEYGSTVTLVATADEGRRFVGWYEGIRGEKDSGHWGFVYDHTDLCYSTETTYSFPIYNYVSVCAVFEEASADRLSGSVTSYLDGCDPVTLTLSAGGSVVKETVLTGCESTYGFGDVADGSYTMTVSKKNHVTREYAVTVSGTTTLDVKLCPVGDVSGDGKVTTKDYAMANAHAQKVSLLSGYALKCGDVLKGDGKITTADAARINAAAQKVDPLW